MSLSPAPESESSARARTDATRQRMLDAAVECISRHGFHHTNLAGIARRAGMTTGAIQHHFGDKASLLAAVVERGFEALAMRLACLPSGDGPGGRAPDVGRRIGDLVEALWSGYEAHQTRASLEILFAMRADEAFQQRSLPFLAQMRERVDRLWMGSLWDLGLPRERHQAAQRLVFATLNGLALERILMPSMPDPSADLAQLVRGVVHIFEEDQG